CAGAWAGRCCPAAWPTSLPRGWRRARARRCWPRCAPTASSCATAPPSACRATCVWVCCHRRRSRRCSAPGVVTILRMTVDDDEAVPLRRVDVRRYVTPLREGGSMPAVVEADDLGLYVLKFRGAGQGVRA